jgi:hypothetical protein
VVSGKNNIFLITFFVSLIAITGAAFIQSQSVGTDSLHPQATVFIVLTGFLFISLMIDRRLGLANMTAQICPGQMRFHSLPQIESTRNINLLHNLAGIPDEKLSLQQNSKHNEHQQERNTNKVPQLPITHFSSLPHPALIPMAPRAEQNLSFSPGFIFVRLARGPPNLT